MTKWLWFYTKLSYWSKQEKCSFKADEIRKIYQVSHKDFASVLTNYDMQSWYHETSCVTLASYPSRNHVKQEGNKYHFWKYVKRENMIVLNPRGKTLFDNQSTFNFLVTRERIWGSKETLNIIRFYLTLFFVSFFLSLSFFFLRWILPVRWPLTKYSDL